MPAPVLETARRPRRYIRTSRDTLSIYRESLRAEVFEGRRDTSAIVSPWLENSYESEDRDSRSENYDEIMREILLSSGTLRHG